MSQYFVLEEKSHLPKEMVCNFQKPGVQEMITSQSHKVHQHNLRSGASPSDA